MSRLASMSLDQMPEDQRRRFLEITAGPVSTVRGPFGAWVRSPELADHMIATIRLLRDRLSLPARLVELAILIAVRHWDARYAWQAHEARGLKAGLGPESLGEPPYAYEVTLLCSRGIRRPVRHLVAEPAGTLATAARWPGSRTA